jgi:L-alanine-DL-glutamate epimerase-like enolase superfamily enzyme
MRVTDIQVSAHQAPPNPNPIRDALQTLPGAGGVEVVIQTDAGVTGRGSAWFGRVAGAPPALTAIIEHELKPLVLGAEVTCVRGIHEALLRETEYHGSAGLTMFGISALDTALWDCLGKSLGLPGSRLWGRVHERIPAYAMVGWLNYGDDEVQRICAQAVEQGFRGVKIKVGYPTLAEDARRVKVVRAAVGDDIALMVDANQSLTVAEAIVRGRAFQELGCLWWEEPIPADDVDGYAALAQALDIAVATGENLYRAQDFARFLRRDAVDILQPDLRRAGGPTALLQIGLMAQAFGRPYASHAGEAAHLHVMASLPNAIYLETGLVGPQSPFQLVDGCVPVPDTPGLHWAEG